MHPRSISSRGRAGDRPYAAAVGLMAALAVALPAGAAGAADAPDRTVVIEGTVVQFIGDGKPAAPGEPFSGETNLVMVEVDGELLSLPDAVDVAAIRGGARVEVTFRAQAALSGKQAVAEVASAGTMAEIVAVDEITPGETSVAEVSTGIQELVVLPVHWGATDGTTVAQLQNQADVTAAYWERQSGGRMDVQPDVRGWQQIPAPTYGCTNTTLNQLYDGAVTAHGVAQFTTTRHIAVYFPDTLGCEFAGLAAINDGYIFLNGWHEPYVLAHEFGHNVGLGHAHTLDCYTAAGTRAPLTDDCDVREYGDYADVMGQGVDWDNPGNLNSGFADALGYAHIAPFVTPPTSAMNVDVHSLGSVTQQRAVRVDLGGTFLYAEFRPAVFPDDLHRPQWAGVQVHLVDRDRGYPTSYLLDMQPESAPFSKASLPVGTAWDIPYTGMALRTTSHGNPAVVTVGPDYITRVYRDLFNRAVDPSGLATWTRALLSGTPRIAVANAITYSSEYRSGLITASYQTFLGRVPDAAGLQHWLNTMAAGYTIQQMESGFLASGEYYLQSGSTNHGWVQRLYQHVLGRGAAPAEVQHWVNVLNAGHGRAEVAMGFLLSTEHLTTVVDGYYRDLLGRGIDASGRVSWVTAIQRGTRVEAIIGGIVASREFHSRL